MDDKSDTEPGSERHVPIKCLGIELTITDPFAVVRRERVRFGGDVEGTHWRITSGNGNPGVVILPWRDGHVGLVRSYRYPVGRWLWELPRGRAISADSRANAARELQEETRADDVELLGLGSTYPDTGLQDTVVTFFVARLAPGCPFKVGEEVDRVMWVPLAELKARVLEGDVTDQFTITALALAEWRELLV
jgi:ADP-ribose pyrophosphatase